MNALSGSHGSFTRRLSLCLQRYSCYRMYKRGQAWCNDLGPARTDFRV